MVGISVKVDFEELLTPSIDDAAIERWIEARLNNARNLFIRNVSRGGGGGRTYRRGRHGQHRASAPGEYPVSDSGRLVSSVDYEITDKREGVLFCTVAYAQFLKEGTGAMAPRKMLREALQEEMANAPPLQGVKWE